MFKFGPEYLQVAFFYSARILCFVYLAIIGLYLMYSKRSAFVTGITPHQQLRRVTGLNMILWGLTFTTSFYLPLAKPEHYHIAKNVANMLDLMVIPAIAYMLLCILQRFRTSRWIYYPRYPIAFALLALYLITQKRYILFINWLLWLQYVVNFTQYYIRTLRRYNKILKERYADLRNREVTWIYCFVFFMLLYYISYNLVNIYAVDWLKVCTYPLGLAAWTYLFVKVEKQDLIQDFWYRPKLVRVNQQTVTSKDMPDTNLPVQPALKEVWVEEPEEEDPIHIPLQHPISEEPEQVLEPEEEEAKDTVQELAWIGDLLQKHCIEPKLYLECDLTIENFARHIGTNRTYIGRYLADRGMTYYTYINKLRIDYVLELMQNTKGKINYSDLALKSGYRNLNTFRKAFKEITGVLPSQYQGGGSNNKLNNNEL